MVLALETSNENPGAICLLLREISNRRCIERSSGSQRHRRRRGGMRVSRANRSASASTSPASAYCSAPSTWWTRLRSRRWHPDGRS